MSSGEDGKSNTGSGSVGVEKKETTGGRRNYQRDNYQKPLAPRQPKFEGKCDGLKGHIYDCSDSRQSELFAKTMKEIAEYVGRTFTKYGSDTRLVVETLALTTLAEPNDPPAGATRTQVEIWKEQVKEYVRQSTSLT